MTVKSEEQEGNQCFFKAHKKIVTNKLIVKVALAGSVKRACVCQRGALKKRVIMTRANKFKTTCFGAIAFCTAVLISAVIIAKALPPENERNAVIPKGNVTFEDVGDSASDFVSKTTFAKYDVEQTSLNDVGLALYRDKAGKSAVKWFYDRITGNSDITDAILTEANNNDIPFSLAFALANTESKYNPDAKNINTNKSIDRGLFQLNNRSFPQIKERDFFNPEISAKYGMQHLRYCLNMAKGNVAAALSYYNAGATKVGKDRTPQSTVFYIGKIMAYQRKLDMMFASEVIPYLDTKSPINGLNVAYMDDKEEE